MVGPAKLKLPAERVGNEVPVNFITEGIVPGAVAPITNLSGKELESLMRKDPEFASKSKLPELHSL